MRRMKIFRAVAAARRVTARGSAQSLTGAPKQGKIRHKADSWHQLTDLHADWGNLIVGRWYRTPAMRQHCSTGGTAMQDMQSYLEKLDRDAVDCALISKRATDPQKKAIFLGNRYTYSTRGHLRPLAGLSRVDGGDSVIDVGATHSAVVVFDDDFTIGLKISDGTEAGMFRGVRRPPLNALPYCRIFFR